MKDNSSSNCPLIQREVFIWPYGAKGTNSTYSNLGAGLRSLCFMWVVRIICCSSLVWDLAPRTLSCLRTSYVLRAGGDSGTLHPSSTNPNVYVPDNTWPPPSSFPFSWVIKPFLRHASSLYQSCTVVWHGCTFLPYIHQPPGGKSVHLVRSIT